MERINPIIPVMAIQNPSIWLFASDAMRQQEMDSGSFNPTWPISPGPLLTMRLFFVV
jgi:hypothetical protein